MAEELLIPKLAKAVEMEFGHILAVEANRKEQTMRLIDADDVLEVLTLMYDDQEDKDDPYNVGVMGAINYIKHKAPSIEIIRCSECKWRKTDNSCDLNCRIEYLDGTETDMWFYVKADDFCSYGEREGE